MKKLIMTIAIVLGMGMATFAQEEVTFEERGLFGKGVNGGSRNLFDNFLPAMDEETFTTEENQDPESPLGSGIAVLMGLGAAYLVGKRRKED